ncbi:sensor histidine kinase [Pedobacter vanadiisoli]
MERHNIRMIESVWYWFKSNRLHLIFWTIYIMYEAGLTGIFAGRFGKAENYIVHYALNISLFYFHYWMMKKFASKHLYLLFFLLLILLEIAIYIPFLATLNHLFTDYNQSSIRTFFGINHKFIASATYRSIFFIIVSTGYWFLRQYLNERKKAEEIEQDRLQQIVKKETAEKNLLLAQNAHLRAQVNPHFLFNVLTFIHRRIRKSDKIAGEVVISLTSLMRYAIETSQNTEMVLLSEEISQVYDLVNILRVLKGDEFNIEIKVDHNISEIKLIPLLLLTVTENMYKHGDLSDVNNCGVLTIYQSNNTLTIESKNLICEKKKSLTLKTGLKNLRERIRDFYGTRAEIESLEHEGMFHLTISIPVRKSKA